MPEPPEDHSLLERWRAGDEKAAQALFERYMDRLVALARRHIGERLARRVDPEDIVQSVFRTFFVRAREGQFVIRDPDDVCKLLARITLHKVLRQANYHSAAKRNMHRETVPSRDVDDSQDEVLAREPSPGEVHAFLDQLEHFLTQLSPQEREILELRAQGCTVEDIAKRLGTYERKIYRVLERVRMLAEQQELPC